MAYEFGGILFIHLRWQATAQLANYQAVVNTGKAAKMSWNAPLMSNGNSPVQGYGLYADTGNTAIRAAGSTPVGVYRTYIVIPID